MNTKGHPLRVAFCIYFKPVSLKKRTLSALPAPLPFFPSQSSPPRSRPACPILWYLSPAHPSPAPSTGHKKSPPHYRGTIKHGTDRGATLPAQ